MLTEIEKTEDALIVRALTPEDVNEKDRAEKENGLLGCYLVCQLHAGNKYYIDSVRHTNKSIDGESYFVTEFILKLANNG